MVDELFNLWSLIMRKFLVFGLVSLGFVSACAQPDVAMKLEKSPTDFLILMGSIENATMPAKSSIFATDGEISCDAKAIDGKSTIGWTKNKIKTTFDVSCSNGASGKVLFQGTVRGYDDIYGAGIGQMSDGSKVKIVVGDAAGTIGW
jgi:hypothetical protein